MESITLMPESEKQWLQFRSEDLTSTDIPALFDLSPYLSRYELWHKKKNAKIEALEPNERMKWGNRLENSIAQGIAQDNKWVIQRKKEYSRVVEYRIGSSFDFSILKPFKAILEIKNVDSLAFKEGWIVEEDSIEAPLHIEFQVQHQLLVSGMEKAYIGALVGGNRVVLIERKADLNIHKVILEKATEFWKSIKEGVEPEPDFKRDAKYILSLYQNVTPLKTIQADDRLVKLAEDYKYNAELEKSWKESKEAIKAKIMTLITDAESVKHDRFSISAGFVGPAHIEYEREGYRNFKLSWKKEKAK